MVTEAFDVAEEHVETRGQRLWQRLLEKRRGGKLSLHRAKSVVASYKETEELPWTLRRALAFERIITEIPLYIDDEDLLVGAFSAEPMACEWYCEFSTDQVTKPVDASRTQSREVDQQGISEVLDYFKDRSLQATFLSSNDEYRRIVEEHCDEGAYVYRAKGRMEIARGYHTTDYERTLRKGFLGVLAEVEDELREMSAVKSEEANQKIDFLKGLSIVLKAGIRYANRYAVLARELAREAEGKRKAELERIADICEWVPANPARNFYEALQTVCFQHILMHLETRAQESLGRMDQYLYPYYKCDIEEGEITREEVIELLECFRVKISSLRLFTSKFYLEMISGEAQYHNVTLGGQTPDGEDATNELSYLFLEAAFRTRTNHPTLSIRWHNKLPGAFALRALELVRTGVGFPAWFNDDNGISYLLNLGVPLEKARNHCISGCVQHTIAGESSPGHSPHVSMAKILELTLHNGTDPRTGKKIGPTSGKFENMKTFDELIEAFKKQVRHFTEESADIVNAQDTLGGCMMPYMLASCFMDDCIKRGSSAIGSGPRLLRFTQISIGLITAVDSLAAIKKCVFDEGLIGKKELLDALAVNFEEKEELRRLLLAAPKYGNDDDYVDSIAHDMYGYWAKMVMEIDGLYGAKYIPNPFSISVHGAAGKRIGALPNGRLAGTSVADGSTSPCQGMDTLGPTAVLNSAAKIDQTPMEGTLLNMKFHPSALKTREDLQKLLVLVKTYFDCGGRQVQFNVVDRKTLLEAQEHPELHRNLIVRVAGYSAFFTELQRTTQDEIIARTEHEAV